LAYLNLQSILDLSESLIIVTADHASAMVYSGFATPKDQLILGMDRYLSNVDKQSYQLLTYSSGLGFQYYNESAALNDHKNAYHKSTIPSTWANHAGDDVPLYATGTMANLLFGGTMDQTFVPHAIAFAMCLFQYRDRCIETPYEEKFEIPKVKAPNKIHQLKKELMKEIYKEDELIEFNTLEDVDANETTLDVYTTLDLISNSTVHGGSFRSEIVLGKLLFLVTVINFVL
jgi:hypothetical protein